MNEPAGTDPLADAYAAALREVLDRAKANGATQASLATQLHLSQSTVSRYLSGQRIAPKKFIESESRTGPRLPCLVDFLADYGVKISAEELESLHGLRRSAQAASRNLTAQLAVLHEWAAMPSVADSKEELNSTTWVPPKSTPEFVLELPKQRRDASSVESLRERAPARQTGLGIDSLTQEQLRSEVAELRRELQRLAKTRRYIRPRTIVTTLACCLMGGLALAGVEWTLLTFAGSKALATFLITFGIKIPAPGFLFVWVTATVSSGILDWLRRYFRAIRVFWFAFGCQIVGTLFGAWLARAPVQGLRGLAMGVALVAFSYWARTRVRASVRRRRELFDGSR
ncbi:helix-turn-helix transcriptional regulator [Streptomyces longisporus]|uniref:HTH cro/C1-type domain-containing protein n=1 Tax=Streptomyces longisporus TaxID=1948 RepID=A0ABN3NLH9_STRLO